MVIKGRTRVSRSKAFTPFWTAARSLDLTRVIWPKLPGRVTSRALDSFAGHRLLAIGAKRGEEGSLTFNGDTGEM